ncbi:hypothetical protein AGMMS49942_24130 [Spirochaetia bacterium]|nr:hypothetical protein AGMMS49942_24130 [Spirochaetia bacterium]
MRIPSYTHLFKKDLKLMGRRRMDMDAIHSIIDLILLGEPLPAHCKEHGLSGNLEGLMDCHVKGGLVLIYEIKDDENLVVFHRLGTHSDLF